MRLALHEIWNILPIPRPLHIRFKIVEWLCIHLIKYEKKSLGNKFGKLLGNKIKVKIYISAGWFYYSSERKMWLIFERYKNIFKDYKTISYHIVRPIYGIKYSNYGTKNLLLEQFVLENTWNMKNFHDILIFTRFLLLFKIQMNKSVKVCI